MKRTLSILLFSVLFFSCFNNNFENKKGILLKATNSESQYLNNRLIHYKEYYKDFILLHIYFSETDGQIKNIYFYDKLEDLIEIKEYKNDTLKSSEKFLYKKGTIKKPSQILTYKEGKLVNTAFFEYLKSQDTTIETFFQSQEDFSKNIWLKKSFIDDKKRLLKIEYNKVFGGGGEKLLYKYLDSNKVDYIVHYYLGYDTTKFKYSKDNLIVITKDKRDSTTKIYNNDGDLIKQVITEFLPWQKDTFTRVWTYKKQKINYK